MRTYALSRHVKLPCRRLAATTILASLSILALASCGGAYIHRSRPGSTPTSSTAYAVTAFEFSTPQSGWVLAQVVPSGQTGVPAVGDRLLVTGDAGQTWSDVTPAALAAAAGGLATFSAASASNAWVAAVVPATAGAPPRLIFAGTENAGVTWRTSVLESNPPLFSALHLHITAGGVGWLAATDVGLEPNGALFQTTDGGVSWSSLPSTPRGGPVEFEGSHGWIAGGPGPGSAAALLTSTDGGSSWGTVNLPSPSAYERQPSGPLGSVPTGLTLEHVSLPRFVNGSTGFVTATWGDSAAAVGQLYRTVDGGQNWTLAGPALDTASTGSVVMAPIGPTEVMEALGGILIRGNGSAAVVFSAVSSLVNLSFSQLDFVTASSGWALAGQGSCTGFKSGCSTSTSLMRTTNGGATWSRVGV